MENDSIEELRKRANQWVSENGRGSQGELCREIPGMARSNFSRFLSGDIGLTYKNILALKAALKKVEGGGVAVGDPMYDISRRLHDLGDFLMNTSWTREQRLEELAASVKALNDGLSGIVEAANRFDGGE